MLHYNYAQISDADLEWSLLGICGRVRTVMTDASSELGGMLDVAKLINDPLCIEGDFDTLLECEEGRVELVWIDYEKG